MQMCKYYVNIMVISYSTCQKKKRKNAIGLNNCFTLCWRNFKFVVIYMFFRQIFIHKILEFTKMVLPSLQNGCIKWDKLHIATRQNYDICPIVTIDLWGKKIYLKKKVVLRILNIFSMEKKHWMKCTWRNIKET